MNAKKNPYQLKYGVKDAPKIRTVGLQFGVTDRDLETKVKAAFDLAKSSGLELNLNFIGDLGSPVV